MKNKNTVFVYIPTLIDAFYAPTAWDFVEFLQLFHFDVKYPASQADIGRYFYEAGQLEDAIILANKFIQEFSEAEMLAMMNYEDIRYVLDVMPKLSSAIKYANNLKRIIYAVKNWVSWFHRFMENPPTLKLPEERKILFYTHIRPSELMGDTVKWSSLFDACRGLHYTLAPPLLLPPVGDMYFAYMYPELSNGILQVWLDYMQKNRFEILITTEPEAMFLFNAYLQDKNTNISVYHLINLLKPSVAAETKTATEIS
ncbi:MAG: hypothetical protein R2798_04965 [Chitinophagales bacterium]|nr:hypothetical protein [Bacteroidota bacterium]MCB9042735.1 hypothetical protein [Chitinophagales bacterium]